MAIELQGQYQALARKYRPQTFEDVVGQEHVINALMNSIEQQRIHHAYLLTGTRGIGKTTIARIIAKCLECENGITAHPHVNGESLCDTCKAIADGNFPDVIEIDGASQTKVDDTRQLLESTQYPPLKGRFKVYIIDEVHMLSQSSFNALLKTLEEPPAYVKFILATTDPQKIPVTVLSRCLQFQLKALTVNQISAQIAKIATKENISFENDAVNLLARAARGSMRDALSLCDQAVALGNGSITNDNVQAMLGTAGDGFVCSVLDLLKNPSATVQDTATVAVQPQKTLSDVLNEIRTISPNYRTLLNDLVLCFHDLALFQMIGYPQNINIFSIPQSTLTTYGPLFSSQALQLYYQIALQGIEEYKVSSDGATAFEMTILRMLAFTPEKKKDWIGEDNSVEVIYLNPVINSAVDGIVAGKIPAENNHSLNTIFTNETTGAVSTSVAANLKADGSVNSELVDKVASENITLNPDITSALVAEANAITNSRAILNKTGEEISLITETDKIKQNSDINVVTETAPDAQDLPSDTVTDHDVVVQTADTTNNDVSAPLSVNTDGKTIQSNSVEANSAFAQKSTLDNISISSAKASPAVEATDTVTVSNDEIPSVTDPNEINEFPVPDINPQSQVFSVNPQNSALDFGSTYGSKSEDLNVLIHGLETLNNQVVTNNSPHLGQYRKVLTNIITPKSTDSSIVPENEELQTNSSFTKLSSLRNNQELQDKFSLISDVSRYINHIYGVLKGYQTEAESLKEGKSKSSHIEGMSSIISDMTYGKNSNDSVNGAANDETPSITDSISKLPSFNENGEIVTSSSIAPDTNNTSEVKNEPSVQSVNDSSFDNTEVKSNVNNAETAPANDEPVYIGATGNLNPEAIKATNADNTNVAIENSVSDSSLVHVPSNSNKVTADDFTKVVQELSSDNSKDKKNEVKTDNNEILTPQVVELTPDELLRKAQEEALAQLQSNQSLNQKLKEEAATLNKNVDASNLPIDDNKSFIEDDKANLNAELPDAVSEGSVSSPIETTPATSNLNASTDNAATNATRTAAKNGIAESTDKELVIKVNDTLVSTDTVKVNSIAQSSVIGSAKVTNNNTKLTNTDDMRADTDLSKVQEFMSLTKALALELQKGSYTDSVPVIKAHTYSQSLNQAITETLNGQLGSNHNAVEGNSIGVFSNEFSSINENKVIETASTKPQVLGKHQSVLQDKTSTAQNTQISENNSVSSSSEVPSEYFYEIPVDAYESDIDPVDNSIVDESYDNDEFSEGSRVKGSDLKFDYIGANENSTNADGNPAKFRESTLKLIEEDQQFENKRLGRRLESCDFYDRVYKNDAWYQDIVKAGYNDGPVYSALCYTNRVVSPDDPYSWVLQISSDFQLLFISPEFHHNLRTKFSIEQEHPVELKIEKVQGIPRGCPEDLARHFYVKEIEDTRQKMSKDKNVSLLLEHLGEDIRTLNLSLYKQEDSKSLTKK